MDSNKRSTKRSTKPRGNNWISRHTYKPQETTKTWGKRHADFQPDATLSIRQMVQRYQQGMSVPVNAVEYLEGDNLHPGADLLDKAEFVKKFSNILQSEIVKTETDAGGDTTETRHGSLSEDVAIQTAQNDVTEPAK